MSEIVALFPGQGSQSEGMLAELAEDWPEIGRTFEEASTVLGYDLWAVVRDNPDGQLNQTEHTQPAMLAAGVAVHRVWEAAGGPAPDAAAGHSLGEYSALVAAGVLEFSDAVRLVAERARLMQNAVPRGTGGMAAILGLDDDAVAAVCESLDTERVVEPVNYNAPGQVVIAGHADAVALAIEAAKAAGAKRAIELPVSVPSHSSLMKEAADALAERFAEVTFSRPAIPVVHNVDARPHDDADEIREALRRQLYNPVRWTDSIVALRADGADRLLELGPGRVLAGLARRIDRALEAHAVDDRATLARALETLGTDGGDAL